MVAAAQVRPLVASTAAKPAELSNSRAAVVTTTVWRRPPETQYAVA